MKMSPGKTLRGRPKEIVSKRKKLQRGLLSIKKTLVGRHSVGTKGEGGASILRNSWLVLGKARAVGQRCYTHRTRTTEKEGHSPCKKKKRSCTGKTAMAGKLGGTITDRARKQEGKRMEERTSVQANPRKKAGGFIGRGGTYPLREKRLDVLRAIALAGESRYLSEKRGSLWRRVKRTNF